MGRFSIDNFTIDGAFIHMNIAKLKSLTMQVYTVPQYEATRMDLIAYTIYQNIELKALLIAINDIVDLGVVQFGYKLRYPAIGDIVRALNEVEENKV